MAGPANYAEQAAELASRPGHNNWGATLVRWLVIGVSLIFLGALLAAPLAAVFATALENGWEAYFGAFADPDTRAAIRLTLLTAAVVVPLNTVFGITAAWCIAKFEFKGKSILITLIDLPLAVSPVVSGLIYVLLFGLNGWFGVWLQENEISIVYALPGIILATMFVTFPYVARELIPLMQQLGNDEEEAARDFIRRYGKTYHLGSDVEGAAAVDYGLYGVPETFFIDRDGTILSRHIGPLTTSVLDQRIAELEAGVTSEETGDPSRAQPLTIEGP